MSRLVDLVICLCGCKGDAAFCRLGWTGTSLLGIMQAMQLITGQQMFICHRGKCAWVAW